MIYLEIPFVRTRPQKVDILHARTKVYGGRGKEMRKRFVLKGFTVVVSR